MRRITALCTAVAFLVLGAGIFSPAGEAQDDFKYVGAQKCRICHRTEKQGRQFPIWQKSKHADAFKLLATPEAKAYAEERGISEDPQKADACLKCHVTGHGQPKEKFESTFSIEEGLGCETCHGPGSAYRPMKVMKDHDASIAAGLIFPVKEERCLECHNEESPGWNPEKYTTKEGKKVGFDFEAAFAMIKHSVPPKE